MSKAIFATSMLVLAAVGTTVAQTRQVVFEGNLSEHKWALKELNPDLPSNWTGYSFLVLEMKVSSPQRFFLNLYSEGVVQKRRMQPFANVWIRASVPLTYYREPNRKGFDMASVYNVPRNTFWIDTEGVYGPLNAVREIGVSMEDPLGKPTLEIRSVRLAKHDPGSDVLDPKPVVNEFGQWIPVDWPDKIKNLDQLKREWSEEEHSLKTGGFNYCPYGGYLGTKAKATGFFRVEKIDGIWWFIDPDGHFFFSSGADCMWAGNDDARIEGREDYFAKLPPANLATALPGYRAQSSFRAWNQSRRFGVEASTKWMDLAIRRMEDWGLNTISNWSDPRLWDTHKKAYLVPLRGWGMETGYLGMPDVYSPEWEQKVDAAAAEQCAPRKDDPYLLGYFIGNEPPWPERESLVVDMILHGNATPMQREAKKFLAQGDSPERRKQFIYQAFARELKVINAAIHKYDPNHLNLGLRFGNVEGTPDEVIKLSRSFDVFSFNAYTFEIHRKALERAYQIAERPILIGEFHFGVPGRGLAAGLVQTRDQVERGVAYRHYVEQAAAFPAFVGTGWFQWVDEPSTGRSDGENYNIGFVDVTDRPYRELVDAVKATCKRLYDVHSGKTAPFAQEARSN